MGCVAESATRQLKSYGRNSLEGRMEHAWSTSIGNRLSEEAALGDQVDAGRVERTLVNEVDGNEQDVMWVLGDGATKRVPVPSNEVRKRYH